MRRPGTRKSKGNKWFWSFSGSPSEPFWGPFWGSFWDPFRLKMGAFGAHFRQWGEIGLGLDFEGIPAASGLHFLIFKGMAFTSFSFSSFSVF